MTIKSFARGLVASTAILAAIGPAAADPIEDATAVQMQYEAAINAGDLAGVAALFAPDGALLPIAGGMFEGPDAILEALQWNRPGTLDITTTNIAEAGDVVVDVGTFVFTPADGSPVLNGEYVSVVRNDGTGAKIARLVTFLPRVMARP